MYFSPSARREHGLKTRFFERNSAFLAYAIMRGGTSFRDPDGFIEISDDRVIRYVYPHAVDAVRQLVSSDHFAQWVNDGDVVKTRELPPTEVCKILASVRVNAGQPATPTAVFEQDKVRFVSYPHEWSPEMLYAAGELTLNLQLCALEHDLMLKDATPLNVLFRGPNPVFVDVLSFVPRPKGMVIWPAYAQFVRTFLLPLLLHKRHGGGTHEVFLARRDGLEPEEVYKRLSVASRLGLSAMRHVTLPTLLGKMSRAQTATPAGAPKFVEPNAGEIAQMLVQKLRSSFVKVQPAKPGRSSWSDYNTSNNYEGRAFAAKTEFVQEALTATRARSVLDVGCNTGHFSRLAAQAGASVISLDYDPVVIAELWRRARVERMDILPLVMNLARPTPSQGWRNCEEQSFLERATAGFDMVMLLAVIHHLSITDGIPLAEIFSFVSKLALKAVVAEFIPPSDSMFQRIIRNKEHLVPRLQRGCFEEAFAEHFVLERAMPLPDSGRIMYFLRKRESANAV